MNHEERKAMNSTLKIFLFIACSSMVIGCEKNRKCEEVQKKDDIVVVNDTASAKNYSEHNRSILKKAGFEFGKDKVIIDTKKTRSFLNTIGTKLHKAFGNLVEKGDGNLSLQKGEVLEISDEKVEIDLKKTKELMRNWVDAIESFSKEVEDIINEPVD